MLLPPLKEGASQGIDEALAEATNEAGQIVEASGFPDGWQRAVWEDGRIVDLGALVAKLCPAER